MTIRCRSRATTCMKNFPLPDRSGARFWITHLLLAVCMLTGGVLTSPLAASADTTVLSITQPSHQETIHNNIGEVPVAVTLQGAELTAGRYLRALLDGKPYGEKRLTRSFALTQVERGEHTLRMELIDDTNAVVATSPTITFYLWQASGLLPPPLKSKSMFQ